MKLSQDIVLPDWAPKDFPLYIPSSVSGSFDRDPLKFFILETEAPVSTVADFYRKEMSARGWTYLTVYGRETKALFGFRRRLLKFAKKTLKSAEVLDFSKEDKKISLTVSQAEDKPNRTEIILSLPLP